MGIEPTTSARKGEGLPLNYSRSKIDIIKMAGLAGFEPAHDGVKVRCLTAWL